MLKLVKLLKVQIPKMIITHHRVVGDGCIWEGMSLINACWVSQLVLCQVLNPVSQWWCVLKKIFYDGEIIFQGWKTFVRVSIMHQKILSRVTKHPGWKRLATLIWKWKGSFQVYTQFRSWFLKKSITRCTFLKCGARMHTKNYIAKFPIFSALKLPPCELVVFTDLIWTSIYLQKTEISKYSWKKIIQLLWTVLTYLLKKCWRWNLTCY